MYSMKLKFREVWLVILMIAYGLQVFEGIHRIFIIYLGSWSYTELSFGHGWFWLVDQFIKLVVRDWLVAIAPHIKYLSITNLSIASPLVPDLEPWL